ncbi:MAG: tetratricopeptide repeat protein, partial [Candidatus Hydrogenedentales bacterium]
SAKAAFEKALGLDAALSQARLLLGVCLLELGDPAAATEQFRLYLKQSPDDDEGRQYLAGALGQQKQYQAAADELKAVVAKGNAKPQLSLDLMYLLIRAGKYDEASEAAPPEGAPILGTLLRACARKSASQPFRPLLDSLDSIEGEIDSECSDYLSSMLFRYGKDDVGEFIVTILKAFRDEGVKSKNVDIVLARTYINLEKDAEAGEVLEAALTQYGPDKWLHYYLGTVYEALDKFKDAEKHLKATLALDPEDSEVMNYLGYMYAENDMKLDEAEKLLSQALSIQPGNAFYLDSQGWIYYRQGKADLALESIRKAIATMTSDDAVLRDHLGDVYLLKGDKNRAVGEWVRANRLDPKLEGVQEKIDKYRKKTDKR